MQFGGIRDDGRVEEFESDPLVQPGSTYLLFLRDTLAVTGRDEFANGGFDRFAIGENGLIQPNGWEAYAGVAAVSGVSPKEVYAAQNSSNPGSALTALARTTVDEAAVKILAAIALAPLPTPSAR